jgi:hypothetical protein
MAITEESRHQLYQRLEEVLGREQATTLMEHLPPVGWADVATKRDLDSLSVATKGDIESLGNVIRVEFHRELRSFLFAVLATNAGLVGLAFAAARLA